MEEKKDGRPSAIAVVAGVDASGGGKRLDGEGTSAGTGVLLHCFAGRSRSVTILLAYLLTLVHRNPPSHPDVQGMLKALEALLPAPTAPSSSPTTVTSPPTHATAIATASSPSTSTAPAPPPQPPSAAPATSPASAASSTSPTTQTTPLTLSRLFEYTKARRPEIKPNQGFVAQLLLLERQLGSVSHGLAQLELGGGGVVEAVVGGVGRVGVGEVVEVERERAGEVEAMAGKERGQEWRKF